MDSLDAVLTSRTTAGSEAESRAAVDAPPPRPMGGTREERAARELAERDAASSKARLEAQRRRETPEGVTDDSWNPLWSPLSQVYNVPTVEPWAAYALALCHVAAFTADLLSYKLAGGSGGDVFLRLALFDDAVVYDSQWLRVFTAGLVDFGLVHFALVNAGLALVGAEAEALLGTFPFLAVYALSAAFGGVASMALDPSKLHVASSDGLMGVLGALLLYSALNVENEWNPSGFSTRLLKCGALAVGLQYVASVPTEAGAGHVVNAAGHLVGFISGATLGYLGLSPTFTSEKFEPPDGRRKNLEDVTEVGAGGPKKVWVGLGGFSAAVVALCAVVVFKRVFDADPRDVF